MNFLEWVGAIFVVLLGLGVAALGIGIAEEKISEALFRRRQHLDNLAIRVFGRDLRAASYWFSEDKSTYDALHRFAEEACATGTVGDASSIREEWRAARKASKLLSVIEKTV